MTYHLYLGMVGDDFTGSSDAASFAAKSGLKTMLFDGIPQEIDLKKEGVQAAIIALKSRMAPVEEAKQITLEAAKWLRAHGAEHIYSKYCSTFDSTPKGNIGPILDNFLEHFGAKASFLCPALPVNGRVVKDGILYINGVPLADSPMKHHPLTPMWDSRLKNLMEAQSQYPCFEVPHDLLYDDAALKAFLTDLDSRHEHYYLVPDYADDEDAERIAAVFGDMLVQSGGSGILTALGQRYLKDQPKAPGGHMPPSQTAGRALLLAGSCSTATQQQIKNFIAEGHQAVKIDADKLMAGTLTADLLWEQVKGSAEPCLIYSTAPADEVAALQQRYGVEPLAAKIEGLMTDLARLAFAEGFTRFIVAGGETSGAVMKALPPDGYLIGESVAPGVPVMVPAGNPAVRLVLKSGNFGDPQFFDTALQFTGKEEGK